MRWIGLDGYVVVVCDYLSYVGLGWGSWGEGVRDILCVLGVEGEELLFDVVAEVGVLIDVFYDLEWDVGTFMFFEY